MEHIPVLLDECIEGLAIKPDGIYVDGTLGRGGHSREIAKKLKTGRLIAIDCDPDAIAQSKRLLTGFNRKITFVRDNFRNITEILKKENIQAADGMLFDLGVSSPQLEDEQRGFSYMQDTALDMRMDKDNPLTAYELVNKLQHDELVRIFFQYGEERYARRIAKAITEKRAEKPVSTTFELNDIILSAIPAAARREKQHPSKRCFQALRIMVGDELGALGDLLAAVPALLKTGGRICIISFHSLEDKIVKKTFVNYAAGCVCPKDFPVCVCKRQPEMKIITRRPVTASAHETRHNPRARSARLRIAEKI